MILSGDVVLFLGVSFGSWRKYEIYQDIIEVKIMPFHSVILSILLYGTESCTVTPTEERIKYFWH